MKDITSFIRVRWSGQLGGGRPGARRRWLMTDRLISLGPAVCVSSRKIKHGRPSARFDRIRRIRDWQRTDAPSSEEAPVRFGGRRCWQLERRRVGGSGALSTACDAAKDLLVGLLITYYAFCSAAPPPLETSALPADIDTLSTASFFSFRLDRRESKQEEVFESPTKTRFPIAINVHPACENQCCPWEIWEEYCNPLVRLP